MLNWPDYSNTKAESDFELLESDPRRLVDVKVPNEFKELRAMFIQARDEIYEKYNIDEKGIDRFKYTFDLEFGLELYRILNQSFTFTNRDASNDDIWKFLSIKVIPDIVHARHGLSATYYYKMSRRVWLKQIYWYVNLGWQGSYEETFNTLKNNTTDTIMNIVERPAEGYNIELVREILKQYTRYNDTSRKILRKVLVLNTALIKSNSPEFFDGGITKYVQHLFERVV